MRKKKEEKKKRESVCVREGGRKRERELENKLSLKKKVHRYVPKHLRNNSGYSLNFQVLTFTQNKFVNFNRYCSYTLFFLFSKK